MQFIAHNHTVTVDFVREEKTLKFIDIIAVYFRELANVARMATMI